MDAGPNLDALQPMALSSILIKLPEIPSMGVCDPNDRLTPSSIK